MGRVVDFGLVRVHRLPDIEGQVSTFQVFGAHGIVLGLFEARRDARVPAQRRAMSLRDVTMVSKAGCRGYVGWAMETRPAMKRDSLCFY